MMESLEFLRRSWDVWSVVAGCVLGVHLGVLLCGVLGLVSGRRRERRLRAARRQLEILKRYADRTLQ